MKKILISAGMLAAVSTLGLTVGPAMIDWNRYQPQIRQFVADQTGCHLEIGDKIKVDLLPAPQITIVRASLSRSAAEASTPFFDARWIRADLSLRSLVQGKLDVEDLTLIEPNLRLGSTLPCTLPVQDQPVAGLQEAPAASTSSGSFSLKDTSVTGGSLSIRPSPGFPGFEMNDIEGRLSLSPGFSSITINGNGHSGGIPLEFTGSLTQSGESGQYRTQIGLDAARQGLKLSFRGRLDTGGMTNAATGRIEITSQPGSAFAQTVSTLDLPASLIRAFGREAVRIEGQLRLQDRQLALSGLEARMATISMTGDIKHQFAQPGNTAVQIHLKQLDWDRLSAVDAGQTTDITAEDNAAAPAAETPPAKITSRISGISIVENLSRLIPQDLSLNVGIDRLKVNNALVRDLRVDLGKSGTTFIISRAEAQLPGSSTFSLDGSMDHRDGTYEFLGDAAFRSSDLRRFLGWLKLEPGNFSRDRLRSADISTQVIANPTYLGLHGIEGRVDSSRISGIYELQEQEASKYAAGRLAIDRLNIDAYGNGDTLPEIWSWLQSDFKGTTDGKPGPASPAAPPSETSGTDEPRDPPFHWLADIEIGKLTGNGLPMEDVSLLLRQDANGLMLERMELGNLYGLSLQASGRLPSLDHRNSASLAVSYHLGDPEKTAARFGSAPQFRHLLGFFGQGNGSLLLEGSLKSLATRLNHGGSKGRMKLEGVVDLLGGTPRVNLSAGTISLPDFSLNGLNGIVTLPGEGKISWKALRGRHGALSFLSDGQMRIQPGNTRTSGSVEISSEDWSALHGAAGNYVIADGRLHVAMDFSADRMDLSAPIRSLRADGKISGEMSLQPGLDFGADSPLAQARRLREFILQGFPANGMPFNGRIALDRGELQINDLALQGRGAAARLRALLDLDKWRVNADLGLYEAGEDQPEFSLHANGPAEHPNLRTSGKWLSGAQ